MLLTVALVCTVLTVCTANLSLNLTTLQSKTTSLVVGWQLPVGVTLTKGAIYATRESSEVTVRGMDFTDDIESYELMDLVTNSLYTVCIDAMLNEKGTEVSHTQCESMRTIPHIRPDSVYVFFIVIGVFVLLVLIGIGFWYLAKRRQEPSTAEEDEGGADELAEDQTPIIKSSQPLAYEANNRPRAGIYDEDIPYITPPLAQLEKV